jgi:hypothetical protein
MNRSYQLAPKRFLPRLLLTLMVTLLLLACGSGDDEQRLDTDTVSQVSDLATLGNPSSPTLVYNDRGDAIALWEVQTQVGRWLYSSVYAYASASWSPSEPLVSVAEPLSDLYPQLVSNGDGFALVWRETTRQRDELYARLFNVGNWSAAAKIGGGEVDLGIGFELISNGTGYAVAWAEDDGSDDRVYAIVSVDGRSWGDAVLRDTAPSAGLPRLASNGSGYALVWSALRLKVSLYGDATWGAVEVVDQDGIMATHGHHQVASNGAGYSVIWSSWNGTQGSLWNRVHGGESGVDWSEAKPLYIGEEIIYGTEMLSNGTGYAVVYSHSDGSSSELLAIVDAMGDGLWSQSQLLDLVPSNYIYWHMATDKSGYAVTWERTGVVNVHEALASTYDGAEWSAPTLINTLDTPDYLQPQNLAGYSGRYAIAWCADSNTYARVFNGVGWGNVELLEQGPGEVLGLSIAVNPLEGIRVAWNQIDADTQGITSFIHALHDTQWAGETILSKANYFVGSSYGPQLLANGQGGTLAVWIQDRNGKGALYAAIHQHGTWGSPRLLEDTYTYVQPQITTNGNGFAVLWQARDEPNFSVAYPAYSAYVQVYDGVNWSPVEPLGLSALNGFSAITSASLASSGEGYVLVYRRYDDSTQSERVLARYYDGVTWRAPVELDVSLFDPFGFTQTACNVDSCLSFWSRYDGNGVEVYASEFTGTTWKTPQLLTSDDYSWGMDIPRLATNGESYLVAWLQGESVIGRVHAGDWGPPTLIGDRALNSWYRPNIPSVQSDGVGYLVAWTGYDDIRTLIKANIFDGYEWGDVSDIYASEVYLLSFDSLGSNDKLAAIADGYALLWGAYEGTTTEIHDLYSSVYDGRSWSAPRILDSGQGRIVDFQLAGNGQDVVAAWLQDKGSGSYDLLTNRYLDGAWTVEAVQNINSRSAFDLDLTGDWDGYRLIWTQAEPDGDDSIRFPWARLEF